MAVEPVDGRRPPPSSSDPAHQPDERPGHARAPPDASTDADAGTTPAEPIRVPARSSSTCRGAGTSRRPPRRRADVHARSGGHVAALGRPTTRTVAAARGSSRILVRAAYGVERGETRVPARTRSPSSAASGARVAGIAARSTAGDPVAPVQHGWPASQSVRYAPARSASPRSRERRGPTCPRRRSRAPTASTSRPPTIRRCSSPPTAARPSC